jgi:hypothetical protein
MKKANRVFIMTAVVSIGLALWLPGFRSRVTAQSSTLAGSYGFSITAGSVGVIQGVITLDGAGNATTGSGITTTVSSDPNATVPDVQPAKPSTGTYTVNPDGTGTITLQNANGKVTSISFVMTDGGSQLMVVVTAGIGNIVGTGTARKQ